MESVVVQFGIESEWRQIRRAVVDGDEISSELRES
jgi:hypothetical protein